MLDYIVAAIALAALIGAVLVVVRKFPTLASIDTRSIPAERHGELKARLIEDRVRRKVQQVTTNVSRNLKPIGQSVRAALQRRYQQLLDLEQRYRRRVSTSAPRSVEDQQRQSERLATMVQEAQAALAAGDTAQAEEKAIAAITRDHSYVPAYRVLADVYLEQHDLAHARETIQFMISRLHLEDDDLYAELGQVASGEGKLDEAKRDYEHSIQLNGTVAEHYLDLSRIELALGDSAAAFAACQKAVELEPNNPKFLDALVEASILAEKRDWAEETMAKLRTVNPDNQKLADFAARIQHLPRIAVRRRSHPAG